MNDTTDHPHDLEPTEPADALPTDVLAQWTAALTQRTPSTSLRDSTIGHRVRLIERWSAHMAGEPFTATRRDVEAFIANGAHTGTGRRSRYLILSELHRFYAWAREEGHTRNDPTRQLLGAGHEPPPAIVQGWTAAMHRRGLAASSIKARIGILGRWWTFTDGQPFATTFRDVEAFIDHSACGSARARYALVSHLHVFYRWAQREELTDTDPTLLVERPRLRNGLPRPTHDTDLAIALALATGYHRAAILLAATSGLRCIELARLQWVDVLEDSLLLHGKGDKDRIVPLHPLTRAALDDLPRPSEYVLPWRGTVHNPGARVSSELNQYLHSIGVSSTAHQLRHWCGSTTYRSSRDLRAVQELLGHASPATTAIYAAFDVDHLRTIVHAIALPGESAPATTDEPATSTPVHA